MNHLIIGDLGNEEILLVACDDGDVISFTMLSISLAINQAVPLAAPWFIRNVDKSAWGLAIHKNARLLAVSSNTHNIDVFAPALLAAPASYPRTSTEVPDLDIAPGTSVGPYKDVDYWWPECRSDGIHVTLLGHKANVPNTAFNNSTSDPEGRYLASTDIEGYVFVWDIYRRSTVFRHKCNYNDPSFTNLDLDNNSGWAVACIDPQIGRLARSMVEAFGCEGRTKCDGMDRDVTLDISEGHRNLPDNVSWHLDAGVHGTSHFGGSAGFESGIDQASVDLDESDPDTISPPEESDTGDEETNNDESDLDTVSPAAEMETGDDEIDSTGASNSYTDEEITSTNSFSSDENLIATLSDPSNPTLTSAINELMDQDGMLPAPDPWDLEEHVSFPSSKGSVEDLDEINSSRKGIAKIRLHFDLFQTTVLDLRLFTNVSYNPGIWGHGRFSNPNFHRLIVSEKALHQDFPPSLHSHGFLERLNRIAQIPELGVIVVGSDTGRVAILTATWWADKSQSGFRIECILPFRSQERQGLRPWKKSLNRVATLMGMAIGPIQGQENPPEPGSTQDTITGEFPSPRTPLYSSRRFRLLLVYSEHTVLSYEISRPTGSEIVVT